MLLKAKVFYLLAPPLFAQFQRKQEKNNAADFFLLTDSDDFLKVGQQVRGAIIDQAYRTQDTAYKQKFEPETGESMVYWFLWVNESGAVISNCPTVKKKLKKDIHHINRNEEEELSDII